MENKTKKWQRPYLSVIVPFYNEVDNVERLWKRLFAVLYELDITFEIIFIDDGSTDGTRDVIRRLASLNISLKAILFRANFGQSAAMAAGFKATRGQYVLAMDGDLQNDPKDIPVLLDKMNEGYDVVSGWRKDRKDKMLVRKIPSKIANRLICSVTDVQLHDTGCSLKIFKGDILRRISLYGELHRFIPALMRMEGANIAEIPVTHHARKFGKSKYSLSRTFRVLMDLTTIRMLMKHLNHPVSFFMSIFSLFFVAGCLTFFAGIYKLILLGQDFENINVLLIMTVLLWASSLQSLFFGLIGQLVVASGKRKFII